jgi:hypothetical protein
VGWDPAADAAAVRRAAAGDVGTAAPAAVLRRRAAGSGTSSRTGGVGRGEDALDRGPAVLDGRELHLQLLHGHRGGMRLDLIDVTSGCSRDSRNQWCALCCCYYLIH